MLETWALFIPPSGSPLLAFSAVCRLQWVSQGGCSISNLRVLPAKLALKLFFIKKAQKFDRRDEEMGNYQEG